MSELIKFCIWRVAVRIFEVQLKTLIWWIHPIFSKKKMSTEIYIPNFNILFLSIIVTTLSKNYTLVIKDIFWAWGGLVHNFIVSIKLMVSSTYLESFDLKLLAWNHAIKFYSLLQRYMLLLSHRKSALMSITPSHNIHQASNIRI